ncbi:MULTISPECIES: formate dehydrogenase accessory protein FdhE [Oxalobacteraceae]|uniref:formate dehydrogenase accessory protein FdhE n=1 Tax=Herminiimonas sp. Marseille-P9896 TaxID=2742211 RepID=UPI0015891CD3|nr:MULTISPECIES: formate dehydrogenase accessory protein FdhE [Oxalobacteraceae]
MTISQARPLLSPEEIAVRAGQQVPHLHMPERFDVFSARETRLRQHAASHAMQDFLVFAAELAHAQHQALQAYPAVALPDAAALDAARGTAQAPLPAALWSRDPLWRSALRTMLDNLLPRLANNPAQAVVQELQQMSDQEMELQADRLLNNIMFGLNLAIAPLIAAGLQVYWTHMLLATVAARGDDRLAPFGRIGDSTRCPCCGSLPTASVSRVDGEGNYRYLHCSLCSLQWHMVRIKCSHCESTKGIHYHSLQAAGDTASTNAVSKEAIEVETCDECNHYLKIVRIERDTAVEPVADDLSSVILDLLISEAGYQRHGVSLLLLFGDPEAASNDDGGGG